MNYRCEIERLDKRTHRVRVTGQDRTLTFNDVLTGWSAGAALTDVFTRLIADSPFNALFWEMPPLIRARLAAEYECVLIDSPGLGRLRTNSTPFREYFGGTEDVVAFTNLGADALLIAPAPAPIDAEYTHLAKFCRTAAPELSSHFWQRIGQAALSQPGDAPTWISTAGLGVGWLHARLDSRPKYYSHAPYRKWPEQAGDTDA